MQEEGGVPAHLEDKEGEARQGATRERVSHIVEEEMDELCQGG